MNTLLTRIADIRTRSHAAKKRFVMGTATLATALIAVFWLSASLATGAFALGNPAPEASSVDAASLQLAGVAGALETADDPARIEIVDSAPASAKKAPEATIIPF